LRLALGLLLKGILKIMKYLNLLASAIWATYFVLVLTGRFVPDKEDFLFASGSAALFALACFANRD